MTDFYDRLHVDGHWYDSKSTAESEEPIGMIVFDRVDDYDGISQALYRAYYKGKSLCMYSVQTLSGEVRESFPEHSARYVIMLKYNAKIAYYDPITVENSQNMTSLLECIKNKRSGKMILTV